MICNTETCIVFSEIWLRILWPTFAVASFRPCLLFRDFAVSHERHAKKNRLEELNWQSIKTRDFPVNDAWPRFSILNHKSWLVYVADYARSTSCVATDSQPPWPTRRETLHKLQSWLQCNKISEQKEHVPCNKDLWAGNHFCNKYKYEHFYLYETLPDNHNGMSVLTCSATHQHNTGAGNSQHDLYKLYHHTQPSPKYAPTRHFTWSGTALVN